MEYSSLECIDWEFSKSNWYYHSILEFQSEHALKSRRDVYVNIDNVTMEAEFWQPCFSRFTFFL